MSQIEKCHQRAISAGYVTGYMYDRMAAVDPLNAMEVLWLDPEWWKALCKAGGWSGEKIRSCVGCGVSLKWNESPTADGKHGGKNGCGSDVIEYDGQWLIEMHRFVDHLAEGKDAESFFAQYDVS
jgi:hypothetical protein